jgi:class 3 adenylate cyclase
VRASETRTYCVGGPAFSPHVAAQVRLRAGERFVLALGLEPGMHRVRSPQLPDALDLRVSPEARMRRLDLRLGDGTRPGAVDLAAGEQVLALTNTLDREMVVRVERLAPREDALTAARAASLPLFRELFPGEVLAPGQLVSVTRVALLVTEVAGAEQLFATLGDARAFELLLRYFRVAGDVVAREGGALLKTVGGGVVAAFEQPLPAARAALALHAALRGEARAGALTLQVAVHAGPAMAATVNDKLDYFGRTANVASRLAGQARPGCVLLSRAVVEEPEVAALLYARGLRGETQALGAVEEGLWGVSVQAAVGGAGEAGAMGQAGVAA